MNNIFRSSLLALILAVGSLHSRDTLLEAKGAYFYPTSSLFREIYSEGAMWGAEASIQTSGQLYTWASGSGFIKQGHSIGLNNPSRIAFYPFGAGIKYLYPVKFMEFYAGAGGLGTYMHIHDHSRGIVEKTCRWGGGAILKGGLLLNCSNGIFFDLFTDYSFLYVPVAKHVAFETQTANLSGWSGGAAIGYRFGAKRKTVQEQSTPTYQEQTGSTCKGSKKCLFRKKPSETSGEQNP